MKRTVYIELYREKGDVILYTIRFDQQTDNETDAFFRRFKEHPEYQEDVQIIVRALQNIERRGAEDRYLRHENNAVLHALRESSNLRLYCLKGHKYCLVLGGGGIKSSQKVQDSPDAFPHFQTMNKVDKAFREALLEGEIVWSEEDDKLSGTLILEIEA